MPLTFIQPKAFVNALTSPSNLKYAYESASNLLCFRTGCEALESGGVVASSSSSVVSVSGQWYPMVNSQNDLNNNYAVFSNDDSNTTIYAFFKQVGGTWTLFQSASLSNGFDGGTEVLLNSGPSCVTDTIFSGVKMTITDNDGPVIIVGILDDGF